MCLPSIEAALIAPRLTVRHTVKDGTQVIKLASLRGGIISELTAAAQPTAALPSEALQCAGVFLAYCDARATGQLAQMLAGYVHLGTVSETHCTHATDAQSFVHQPSACNDPNCSECQHHTLLKPGDSCMSLYGACKSDVYADEKT